MIAPVLHRPTLERRRCARRFTHSLRGELRFIKALVQAGLTQQRLVSAALYDAALLHDQNLIGTLDLEKR